jgi:uncharacterized phage protein (TIGR02216 family)
VSGWPDLMRLAAVRFAVPPAAFWALSLREWRALAGETASAALTRQGLCALMRLHPDEDFS